MMILDAGAPVWVLRFSPDSRRLLSGTAKMSKASPTWQTEIIDIWNLADGTRHQHALPERRRWLVPNELAFHPTEHRAWLAVNEYLLEFDPTTGDTISADTSSSKVAVAISADGERRVFREGPRDEPRFIGYTKSLRLWEQPVEEWWSTVAGFLPDGDRFVTLDSKKMHIRSFSNSGDSLASVRYPTYNVNQPQVSPDGKHLGVLGYAKMYLYDLHNLGTPRAIGGTATFGDFRSFAFHPTNGTLAVIHGGPTQIKLYDLATLELRAKLNWKLGRMWSVAFSPDGTLAAAGSDSGKIIVWDVDV